jgi:hypothetical protein
MHGPSTVHGGTEVEQAGNVLTGLLDCTVKRLARGEDQPVSLVV